MMSPFRMGMVLMKPIALRLRTRMLKMPIAARLPKRVETVAAIRAIKMVLTNAFINEWCAPVWNNDSYSFSEKPLQLPKTFASVNE